VGGSLESTRQGASGGDDDGVETLSTGGFDDVDESVIA